MLKPTFSYLCVLPARDQRGGIHMSKKHLTAQFVERVKAPKSGQIDIIDAGFPGLALRIKHGGRKSWQLLYTWQGKSKRLALGTYPDVKLAAARRRATRSGPYSTSG